MFYGERSSLLVLINATRWLLEEDKNPLVPFSYISQWIPVKFMGLLELLNLNHGQSAWLRLCDCGGGHYDSALALEGTGGMDDIRKSHYLHPSLQNFSNRNEVAELAGCLLGLPSHSSEWLPFCAGTVIRGAQSNCTNNLEQTLKMELQNDACGCSAGALNCTLCYLWSSSVTELQGNTLAQQDRLGQL